MVKILSRSGDSLADAYDVKGSIAGIEQLNSQDVSLVHEMGATLASERFSTTIRQAVSGDINQSTVFSVTLSDLPSPYYKIQAVMVEVDTAARMTLASLTVEDPVNSREIPIWWWDSTTDIETRIRWKEDAGGIATHQFLEAGAGNRHFIPQTIAGTGQPQSTRDLVFRGQSNGFGAGTVEASILIHIEFIQVGGISSRGLPIPNW